MRHDIVIDGDAEKDWLEPKTYTETIEINKVCMGSLSLLGFFLIAKLTPAFPLVLSVSLLEQRGTRLFHRRGARIGSPCG